MPMVMGPSICQSLTINRTQNQNDCDFKRVGYEKNLKYFLRASVADNYFQTIPRSLAKKSGPKLLQTSNGSAPHCKNSLIGIATNVRRKVKSRFN
jgi:hypothetical protein